MPVTDDEAHINSNRFYNIARFPRCIGAIDCTHVRISSLGGNQPEIFRNRKNFFSFNVQAISDAELKIQNIMCRWPGSAHDTRSFIFNNSNIRAKQLQLKVPLTYTKKKLQLKIYLMNPRLEPEIQSRGVLEYGKDVSLFLQLE
nr:unnamed protein product [Callosobruchus analis]